MEDKQTDLEQYAADNLILGYKKDNNSTDHIDHLHTDQEGSNECHK